MPYSAYCIFILTLIYWNEVVNANKLRVKDGRDANLNEFPYVLQLELHLKTVKRDTESTPTIIPICTAAALSPSWTLTATHCVSRVIQLPAETLSQVMKIRQYPQGKPSADDKLSAALKVIVPPYQRSLHLIFTDVALIQNEPVLVSNYAKISAVDYTTLYGHEVVLVGYGYTNNGENNELPFNIDKPLQVIDKAMLKECDKSVSQNMYPSLCVVPACGHTSEICKGDSGAPILHPSGVVGVVSRIPDITNCQLRDDRLRNKDYLTVTPLSPFIDWISDVARAYNETTNSLQGVRSNFV